MGNATPIDAFTSGVHGRSVVAHAPSVDAADFGAVGTHAVIPIDAFTSGSHSSTVDVDIEETGSGSPGFGGVHDDAGSGSPSGATADDDAGSGDPIYLPPGSVDFTLRPAWSYRAWREVHGISNVYGEDGGALVELVASAWPVSGPYLVFFVAADGTQYPSYSAVPEQGKAIYANASFEFLRCTIPRLLRGTYAVLVTWGAGQEATLESAVRIIQRIITKHTRELLTAVGTYPLPDRKR
jgi:hypothetical protein